MKKSLLQLAMLALVTTGCSTFATQPQSVESTKLPVAVQKTLKSLDVKDITEIEIETEHGQTVYEVEYEKSGVEYHAEFDAQGKILEFESENDCGECKGQENEVEITLDQLPKAVKASLATIRYDKIVEVEKETENGTVFYEVELMDGKEEKVAEFSANGTLIELEEEEESNDK